MSNCPSSGFVTTGSHAFNVSELLLHRWEDSPKDDRKRLEKCWGYNDCGDCHRSVGFCGWCAISSTCLPLPKDPLSRAFPLLAPIRYKSICAMGVERFELRTGGLGCQVSTITFLTSVVTIFCTIGGLVLLYGIVKLFQWLGLALRAKNGGWVAYADGTGEIWVRKREGFGRWWRRIRGRPSESEELVLDGGTQERSQWWWTKIIRSLGPADTEPEERRPLFSQG